MKKIICNRVKVLPRVDDLMDLFSGGVDVAYSFGPPLNTNVEACTFINPLSDVPDELKKHTLSIMNPYIWTKENVWKKIHTDKFHSICLNVLHNAHVFGGRIDSRDSVYHNYGQLILMGNYSILNASLGVLDGSETLPRDLVEYVDGKHYLLPNSLEQPEILSGDYYFIGSVHHHFGHFLVEGLSRLWAIKHIPQSIKEKLQYVIYEDSIKDYAIILLSQFGININNILFAPRYALLERVFVPDIAYKTHHWASSLQSDVYKLLMSSVDSNKGGGEYIYLSRKKIPDRPLSNELDLEKKLQELGFNIIYPELLDIESQLSIMKDAKIVVGPVGSQMYLSAFLAPSSHVVICAPSNFYLPDDMLISSIKEISLSVLTGSAIDFTKPKRYRNWEVNVEQFSAYVASLM